jgi:hypothetical protein
MNTYRLGVDFKIAPRTVLSYDQFLDYYKGDTTTNWLRFAEVLVSSTGHSSGSSWACPSTLQTGTLCRGAAGNQSGCWRSADEQHLQRLLQLLRKTSGFAPPRPPSGSVCAAITSSG